MGILVDKIEEEISNTNLSEYFKQNTSNMYEQYRTGSDLVTKIPVSSIVEGRFYHFMYKDDSNWMKYSPVFVVDFKKIENKIILYCINFNFIPLEVRGRFFDKFTNTLSEEDQYGSLTFESVYKELLKIGYEYSLMEYNAARIVQCSFVSIQTLSTFLYSAWPTNKYDPQKLYSIWAKKLETKEQRHQEIIKTTLEDYYKITNDIESDVKLMKEHINRIQKGENKYTK